MTCTSFAVPDVWISNYRYSQLGFIKSTVILSVHMHMHMHYTYLQTHSWNIYLFFTEQVSAEKNIY